MDSNTLNGENWVAMAPGVRRRTLVHGPSMMQMLVELDGGARLPVHSHPHEQIAFVLAGRLRFMVSGAAVDVGAGESIYLGSDVPHGVEVLEAARVIDTFSPPREDLLAGDGGTRVETRA